MVFKVYRTKKGDRRRPCNPTKTIINYNIMMKTFYFNASSIAVRM